MPWRRSTLMTCSDCGHLRTTSRTYSLTESLSVMVTLSILSDVTRSMPDKHGGRLKARLLRRLSVTIFGLLAVKRPLPNVVCGRARPHTTSILTVLVGSWNDDVSIISILTELVSWGHSPQIWSVDDIRHRANRWALYNRSDTVRKLSHRNSCSVSDWRNNPPASCRQHQECPTVQTSGAGWYDGQCQTPCWSLD